jgi:hypothetical protein
VRKIVFLYRHIYVCSNVPCLLLFVDERKIRKISCLIYSRPLTNAFGWGRQKSTKYEYDTYCDGGRLSDFEWCCVKLLSRISNIAYDKKLGKAMRSKRGGYTSSSWLVCSRSECVPKQIKQLHIQTIQREILQSLPRQCQNWDSPGAFFW